MGLSRTGVLARCKRHRSGCSCITQVVWRRILRMLGKSYDTQVCSIARALELVGERWSLLILRSAVFAGSTRYGEFQRSLGIATNILQNRLDGLVAAGIMERQPA